MGRWRRDELADIDPNAVLRAVLGDNIPALTKGERFLAVLELHRRGNDQPTIARRLHINQRQVYRYLEVAGRTRSTAVSHTEWSATNRALLPNVQTPERATA